MGICVLTSAVLQGSPLPGPSAFGRFHGFRSSNTHGKLSGSRTVTHRHCEMLPGGAGCPGHGKTHPGGAYYPCLYLGGGDLLAARDTAASSGSPALGGSRQPTPAEARGVVCGVGDGSGQEVPLHLGLLFVVSCHVTSHPKPTSPRPTPGDAAPGSSPPHLGRGLEPQLPAPGREPTCSGV